MEHIGTVRDEKKARDIVERWAWRLDTPNGDLCPHCARVQALGMLEQSAELNLSQSPLSEFDGAHGTFWSKVLSIEHDEIGVDDGPPRCEQCGGTLSWTVTPDDSGQYLCKDCLGGKAKEC